MNIAILTAGGTGTRTHQDLPKQFLTVENKPIIIYTLEVFQQHPSIDEIYVSCLEGWSAVLEAYAKQFNITKLKRSNNLFQCQFTISHKRIWTSKSFKKFIGINPFM